MEPNNFDLMISIKNSGKTGLIDYNFIIKKHTFNVKY